MDMEAEHRMTAQDVFAFITFAMAVTAIACMGAAIKLAWDEYKGYR
jgi:hypothetical protein